MSISLASELESIVIDQFCCMDQTPLQLDGKGIKGREDGERGGGGGDYFKYFGLKRAIIRGRRLISRDGYYSRKYGIHTPGLKARPVVIPRVFTLWTDSQYSSSCS